jgi:thiosulfate/3-mercaptopyruvate sulfurtransferase
MSTAALVFALSAAVAPATGLLVSPPELAAEMNDPSVVILHADANAAGFEAGHIKGARFVGYNQITIDGANGVGSELPPVANLVALFAAAGVSDSSRIVIYGPALAATRTFFTLDYLGLKNVRILNGGFAAWKALGLETEQGAKSANGAKSATVAKLTPHPRPEVVAMAEWISQRLESPQMALIDARPDAEFTGDDGGMGGAHSPGHIPGAKQLVWTDLVSRTGEFISDAELRAKMTAAGARAGVPVVSYCMVGMRASVVYFVARHLGYDAKMYDGSIIDWGQRKLPVRRGR